MERKIKKGVDDHTLAVKEIKRHMSALGEEYQGRLDGVIEQFGGMNKRFDALDKRFDGVDKKLDSHAEMIAKMMVQLQEIQSDMKQKVDLQQFARLEKRVVLLEAKSHR